MEDRELLELAAKAAGAQNISFAYGALALYNPFGETGNCFWNPLVDDGDALRLAVKRSILRCHMDLFHNFYEAELEHGRGVPEATRRAIVRAAAEIGKELP